MGALALAPGHGTISVRDVARLVDARGLLCPLPLLLAREALATLAPGEDLVVLATDREAPIDLAALAADSGLMFEQEHLGGEWRLTLRTSGRR